MIRRSGLLLTAAGLLLLALGALLLAPRLARLEWVRAELAAQCMALAGVHPEFSGELRLSLLPRPRIETGAVRLSALTEQGLIELLSAESTDFAVALWPLLTGALALESAEAQGLRLSLSPGTRAAWAEVQQRLNPAPVASAANVAGFAVSLLPPLRSVELRDAFVLCEGEDGLRGAEFGIPELRLALDPAWSGEAEIVAALLANATLPGLAAQASASLRAMASFGEERLRIPELHVELTLEAPSWLPRPVDAGMVAQAEASMPLSRLDVPAFTVALPGLGPAQIRGSGALRAPFSSPRFEGELALARTRAAPLLGLLGLRPGAPDHLAVSGRLVVGSRGVRLDGLEARLGPSSVKGWASLGSGRLAFALESGALDLDWFDSAGDGAWPGALVSDATALASALSGLEVNGTLRAHRLVAGGAAFSGARLTARRRPASPVAETSPTP